MAEGVREAIQQARRVYIIIDPDYGLEPTAVPIAKRLALSIVKRAERPPTASWEGDHLTLRPYRRD